MKVMEVSPGLFIDIDRITVVEEVRVRGEHDGGQPGTGWSHLAKLDVALGAVVVAIAGMRNPLIFHIDHPANAAIKAIYDASRTHPV